MSPEDTGDPDFLLVDSGWVHDPANGAGAARELLGRWRERGLPAAYWFTGDRGTMSDDDEVAADFDVIAVADPEAAPLLAARASVRTTILPLACPLFPDRVMPVSERPIEVVLVEPRENGLPPNPVLEAVVEAAEAYGLQRLAADSDSLNDALQRAKVTIIATPVGQSQLFAPEVTYRAVGLGSLALTAPYRAFQFGALRDAVTPAKNSEQAQAELERLLRSEADQSEMQRAGRDIVGNGHLYAHRVATLASALGRRVLPLQLGNV